MKKNLFYFAFALVVIAVSTAYARRGPSSVFTFAVHPLAGYANQIGNTTPPPAPTSLTEPDEAGEFDLF